jgi:hypothetical protein
MKENESQHRLGFRGSCETKDFAIAGYKDPAKSGGDFMPRMELRGDTLDAPSNANTPAAPTVPTVDM